MNMTATHTEHEVKISSRRNRDGDIHVQCSCGWKDYAFTTMGAIRRKHEHIATTWEAEMNNIIETEIDHGPTQEQEEQANADYYTRRAAEIEDGGTFYEDEEPARG